MRDWERLRERIPEALADLPWRKVNWALHILWAFLILTLLNSCGSRRNFDGLSVSLAALEIFLIVAFVAGFWILRPEVKDAAREEAKRVATLEARRAAQEWLADRSGSDEQIQTMIDAMDDGEDSNG